MKIGIDIRNVGKKRTGDEAVFFNIVKNLALIDQENSYYLFTDILEKKIIATIKKELAIQAKENFQIITLKTQNKFSWNFWTLPKYLRKNPVDIYLTQYITPFFVKKKIKIITIIHDISFNFFSQFIKWSDLIFLKILIPLSIKRADKIIGVSQFTHQEIIKYYKVKSEKVTWIYNSIAQNFYQPINQIEIEKVQIKYKLPAKFILYMGTLQPRKNVPVLLRAYAQFLANKDFIGEKPKLVLAGVKGYNYDKKIDRVIAEEKLEGGVIFAGYIADQDKPSFIASAQIFCFPSFYEGFGMPILEALAMKVPVLASDIPPHREIAGGAVLFFNPSDSSELAEKIKKIINNKQLQEELVNKGILQINNFSWLKTAEKLLKIFEKL